MNQSIRAKTRRFFRLYEGEVTTVLLFALLGAVLQCGIAVGISAADALFLNHRGAAELPIVYVISPLAIIGYIISHTVLIGRIGIDRVFDLTLILLACIVVAIALLFGAGFGDAAWMYYAAKLTTMIAWVALYTLFWNVADSYFTIIDAKRLFAYLSGGCAVGAALGGALVSWLSALVPVNQLFAIWAMLCLLAFPIYAYIRKNCKRLDSSHAGSSGSPISDDLRKLSNSYRRSPFGLWITLSLFLTIFLSLLCEYQYYGIMASGRSEAQLAQLLGKLNCAVSVFNLIVNILLFNRLVEWLGVRNVALLQSIAYVAVFSLLVVEHTELAALLGFFAYHGLFISIDGNNFNLLLGALPEEERKQLRTFIEGVCEPVANALVGGGLLLSAASLSPNQISAIGLIAAVLCFLAALMLRMHYARSMVENLRSRWLDFSKGFTEIVSEKHSATTSRVISEIFSAAANCTPSERRILGVRLCGLGSRAVPGCVKLAQDSHAPLRARSLAIRALSRISFAQLEQMTDELVSCALYQAYDTFLFDEQILQEKKTAPIQDLVLRATCDRRKAIVEFILEILAFSGRLAAFEPIAASLRSNDHKSRGTAIEAIEQACTRKVQKLLRPLLDERERDKRLVLARKLHSSPQRTLIDRVLAMTELKDDFECALGFEILYLIDPEQAQDRAAAVLASQGSLVRDSAEAISARAAGGRAESLITRASSYVSLPGAAWLGAQGLLALARAALDDKRALEAAGTVLALGENEVSIHHVRERNSSSANAPSSSILFNFDTLIQLSRSDYGLALNLYDLLRRGSRGREAIA